MYKLHTFCRACGYARPNAQGIKSGPTEKLIEVFDLGIQPLANDFRKQGAEHSGYAPLKVLFCPRCSLAQLSVVVGPMILYRNYCYVTSPSNMMQDHFKRLLNDIAEEAPHGKAVLEIGSNDGRLLAVMQQYGYSVLGVEPARNLGDFARENGVPTQEGFFCEDLAGILPESDIVIARHVFCHVDDWQDFIHGLENVTHEESLVCIETPYAWDTLRQCQLDQIYHEHLSYLTLKSVDALLKDSAFRLHRVIQYPIHGGTLLLMLRHKESRTAKTRPDMVTDEVTAKDWKDFAAEARNQIDRLKATVATLQGQGKTIAGLGASAKSTVWINACGFSRKHIGFIADTTNQKLYTCSPGTDIPIVDEGAILRELPDYVIMFCWNYRDEVIEKFSLARSKGVKFIVPVPRIEIV